MDDVRRGMKVRWKGGDDEEG
jgi:hypothetical protein